MGARYSGIGSHTVAAAAEKTNLYLFNGGTATRGFVYDIMFGFSSAPSDIMTLWQLERGTAVGIEGSGYTPEPTDPDGPASNFDFGVAHSTEPTYTAASELLNVPLHARATQRWVANVGNEIMRPATANAGVGWKTISSGGTPTGEATMFFHE